MSGTRDFKFNPEEYARSQKKLEKLMAENPVPPRRKSGGWIAWCKGTETFWPSINGHTQQQCQAEINRYIYEHEHPEKVPPNGIPPPKLEAVQVEIREVKP